MCGSLDIWMGIQADIQKEENWEINYIHKTSDLFAALLETLHCIM